MTFKFNPHLRSGTLAATLALLVASLASPAAAQPADEPDAPPSPEVDAEVEGEPETAPPETAPPEPAPPEPKPEPDPEPVPPAPQPEVAPEPAAPSPRPRRARPRDPTAVPQIDVIGRRPEALDSVPGSASVVEKADLEQLAPLSGNEVLRTLPGVHVVDEEGLGLRPNIGIRGLNPTRGRTLLVLEDGVPIALAPYGEPELYYAPSIERMQRLELVKGSGSILFGPQTIGGVLNYITEDPPEELTVTGEARGGTLGYLLTRATVGDTAGQVGYLFGVTHRRFGGHRGLNAVVTDVSGKLRLRLDAGTYLGVKVQVYDELSSATYLGLTTPQFERDPSANFAIHDELPVRRYAASAGLHHLLGDSALLQTVVYAANTTRNWRRQDFDRSDDGRDYERIIDGEGRDIGAGGERPDDGSAIYFRDATGNRNRAFVFAGIEPRVTWDYALSGRLAGELIGGARLHVEEVSEQRVDGQFAASSTGVLREDERRGGTALAAYVQNRFLLDERLRISPGLRLESFWAHRRILRQRVMGVPTDLEPPFEEDTHTFAVIPGLGVSYTAIPELTLFAGAHRGFSPPRTKDAVTYEGTSLQLDAEYSWNFELGARGYAGRALWGEVGGFLLLFTNQIVPPSEAAGAAADQELVNSGETRHVGAEVTVGFDPAALSELRFRLPLTVNYTAVHSVFGAGWIEEIEGKRLPYAPRHIVSSQLRFLDRSGLAAQVTASYVGLQYTDKQNRGNPTVDGLIGRIDPYLLLDARVAYTHEPARVTAFVAGKNLTDRRYIASRAPQGIQPGLFRHVLVGVEGQF